MDQAEGEGEKSLASGRISVSAAFEGSEEIAEARALARSFLTDVQAVHGLPVSGRAMGMVQLVVSELVTNARKYAPGPCLLGLEVVEGAVEVSVWDSSTSLPSVQATDPNRVGQHGLELVMAVSRTFAFTASRWASGSPPPSYWPTTPAGTWPAASPDESDREIQVVVPASALGPAQAPASRSCLRSPHEC